MPMEAFKIKDESSQRDKHSKQRNTIQNNSKPLRTSMGGFFCVRLAAHVSKG
jgi:hypothetical protein